MMLPSLECERLHLDYNSVTTLAIGNFRLFRILSRSLTDHKCIRDNPKGTKYLPADYQMSRLYFLIVAIATLLLAAPSLGAQQKRAAYGPVVNAYLTGLREELNELEYQLSHREITRTDYERSKQRLSILRRFVERHAAGRSEDIVPEFLILTDDELGTLGLSRRPNPLLLQSGELLEGLWKFIGTERGRIRFLIFERVHTPKRLSDVNDSLKQKSDRKFDPLELIETIVVHERPPAESNRRTHSDTTPDAEAATEKAPSPSAQTVSRNDGNGKPQIQGPRVLHIYLPRYSEKARAKNVEGELIVRALFQRNGRIKEVKVVKGLGFDLDQRAVEAVKRIGFVPALSEGKEIDASAQIVFNFKLDKVTVRVETPEAVGSFLRN